MARRQKKPNAATVAVTRDDLAVMKHSKLGLSPAEVKSGAKTRAASREFFLECKSVSRTITAMLSGLPKHAVDDFWSSYRKG